MRGGAVAEKIGGMGLLVTTGSASELGKEKKALMGACAFGEASTGEKENVGIPRIF